MKKITCFILMIVMLFCFAGCSTDTYSQSSTSKNFKLKRVVSVELSGPAKTLDGEKSSVTLTSDNGQVFADFITLVKGKKLNSIPEKHTFGLAVITYTTQYDEIIKAYPAVDGSNYVCLYTLNEDFCKYLELPDETMEKIRNAFKTNSIWWNEE